MAIFIKHTHIIYDYLVSNKLSNPEINSKILKIDAIDSLINTNNCKVAFKNLVKYCSTLRDLGIPLKAGEININNYGLIELGLQIQENYLQALQFITDNQSLIFPFAQVEILYSRILKFTIDPLLFIDEKQYGYIFSVEYHLSQIYSLLKQLICNSLLVKKIKVKYAENEYSYIIKNYFNCEVIFNSPENSITIDITRDKLYEKITPYPYRDIRKKIDILLNKTNVNKEPINKMKSKILSILDSQQDSNINEFTISNYLNMHPRTLRRKLHSEGISFREIINEYKMNRAIFLISSTNYNYKQIAFMIGFKNNASFSKAFKKWTGKTPQEFKKNLDY